MSYTTVNGLLTGVADAIRAKDGTSAAIATQDMPTKIAAIPTGPPPKTLPADWPDIHAIVEADVQTGYTYKAIVLLSSNDGMYFHQNTTTQMAHKLMDGTLYTTSGARYFNHSYDTPTSEGYNVQWAIFYFASQVTMATFPAETLWIDLYNIRPNSALKDLPICKAIDGVATPVSQAFSGNSSQFRFPSFTTTAVIGGGSFFGCSSMEEIPSGLNFANTQNCNSMFTNCHKLTELPNSIGMTTTGHSEAYLGCLSLTKLPTYVKGSSNISFADAVHFNDKDSLAKFNTSGNITGGMVYNMNTPATVQTMTLNKVIKSYYSDAQRTKIAAMFTAKKWTLTW